MIAKIRKLDWDSSFFRTDVRIIDDENLDEKELGQCLEKLLLNTPCLVYWPAIHGAKIANEFLSRYNGQLVDEKVELKLDISYYSNQEISKEISINEFESNEKNILTLKELSLVAGELSRFNVDPYTRASWEELYTLWIDKAIKEADPSKIFVITTNDIICGFIALAIDNSRGRISLLAVSPQCQGLGYGSTLIKYAIKYCFKNGCKEMFVNTQLQNKKALKLYQKCGFEIESINDYYHFRLGC